MVRGRTPANVTRRGWHPAAHAPGTAAFAAGLTARANAVLLARSWGAASRPARVYLTGGATAVLLEWRRSTIDVDLIRAGRRRE